MSTRIITKMNELTGGLISKGELARENLYKQKKTMKCASCTGGDFRNILSSELKRDADAWFIASQSKNLMAPAGMDFLVGFLLANARTHQLCMGGDHTSSRTTSRVSGS